MSKSRMLSAALAGLFAVSAFATEGTLSVVPVFRFDASDACRGALFNTWDGDRKGRIAYDAETGGVRLTWTNSVGCFLFGSAFDSAFSNAVAKADGMLRFVQLETSARGYRHAPNLRSETTKGAYVHVIGVPPDGQVHVVRVRPGGFSHSKSPFNPREMYTCRIYIPGGSGDFTIRSVSLVFDKTPRPSPEPEVGVDDFRLFPAPRLFEPRKDVFDLGGFAKPRGLGRGAGKAVDWFTTRLMRFWPTVCATTNGAPIIFALKDTPVGARALLLFNTSKAVDDLPAEGYAFRVSAKGIVLVASDEMGLMHGARALMDTIHLASGDVGPARARAVTVADAPRLANRVFYTPLPGPEANGGNRVDPAFLDALFERFVYPARMSAVALDLSMYYKYACDKGSGYEPGSWNPSDFTNMVDRLNAVGVAAMPFFMSPGHQWMNILHGCRNMELSENGDCESLCVRHPDLYPRLFAYMSEVASVCVHNGVKSPYFYTGGDEVRWRDRDKNGKECPRCQGVPRRELLLEHITRVDDWCRQSGYAMLMCSDMYAQNHNGCNAFQGAMVADRIPKSVQLVHWSSLDWDDLPLWQRRGNGSWRIMTGYNDDPVGQTGLVGNGIAMYDNRWWVSFSRAGDSGGYSPLAIAFAGADGWGEPPAYSGSIPDRAATWGNYLMRRWSRKPIPQAGDGWRTIDLSAAANATAASGHDLARTSVGGVATRFACAPQGGARIVAAGAEESSVKVGGRASSLVFWHVARLAAADEVAFRKRGFNLDWRCGAPIATWNIRYTDGTQVPFVVRYGWNVGDADPTAGGRRQPYGRYIGDARYAWTDADGATVYAHEWVNPHPEKEIASLVLGPKPMMVGYELWALTARPYVRASAEPDVYERIDAMARAAVGTNGAEKVALPPGVPSGVNNLRGGRRWWWSRVMRAHAQAARLRAARGGRLDVLLIGDSITQGWEGGGASFYSELCEGREVMNVANGGDGIGWQDWIVRQGLLDGLSAKVVCIMIGTNEKPGAEDAFVRTRQLVEFVREKMPDATILLCGIPPCLRESEEAARLGNAKTNEWLKELCDGTKTVYLDVGAPMREALKWPEAERRKVALDLLHPAASVYEHWLSLLRPYLPAPAGDVPPMRHVAVQQIGKVHTKGNYASGELNTKLSKILSANPGITHLYLRYRTSVPYLSGKLATIAADDAYYSVIGFSSDGQVHDAVIPMEGWSRSGVPLRVSDKMRFVFELGEGELELIEVGVVEKGEKDGWDILK